jgi:NADH dehydrogenase
LLKLKLFVMKNLRKKIVVVGGGFAGVNFVKALAADEHFEVTLVDIDNYHSFSPLLYQVGMAFIEPSNISYPFRRLFQEKRNLRFHLGELKHVDIEKKLVETTTGQLSYDSLVIALGTESNYFGMENVKKHALQLKTISDATNLRNHLLLKMEEAVREKDLSVRESLLNVVVAGAGPSGVEVAGMLAELSHTIGPKEYPEIKGKPSIYLIEAAPVVLGPMSRRSQKEAFRVLNKLGVKILVNTAVKDYVDGKVVLGNGDAIPTQSLIWTSGVIGREVPGLPTKSIGRGRRIVVDAFNKVKDVDNVYAIGDIALQTSDPAYVSGHPQLAQVAIQQGISLAENFKRSVRSESIKPFTYKNKGTMAIISKYNAVVDLPKIFIKGPIAWIAWLFIHLIPLVGFRNKVKLAFSWLWSFITNDPTLRLIIRPKAAT